MSKINSVKDLKKLKTHILDKKKEVIRNHNNTKPVEINVAMATCGIASGAVPVYEFLLDVLPKRNILAKVKKTGCMGYCYAEPTIEITLPGREPVVFGYVDIKKADEIIERFIKKGQLVDGIIPINYEIAN